MTAPGALPTQPLALPAEPVVQPETNGGPSPANEADGLWRSEGSVGTVASGQSWGRPEDTLMQQRFRAATVDVALAALLLAVVGGYLGLYVWIFTKAPLVAVAVLGAHLAALAAVLVRERRRADVDRTEAAVFRPEPTLTPAGFDHPELEADVIDLATRPDHAASARYRRGNDAGLASVTPLISPSAGSAGR